MRKLLLTLLVALLTVPVFAIDNPDLNGDNSLNVPFTGLVGSGSSLSDTKGVVKISGFTADGSYISSVAASAKTVATITSEEAWNRPIQSVTLDVKQSANRVSGSPTNFITSAYVYLVNPNDTDDREEIGFTSDLRGMKSGELTVDLTEYSSTYADYKVEIAITLAKGAAAGTVQLNSVTYEFLEVSEGAPTITWNNGVQNGASFSITKVNPDFSKLPNGATVVPAGYDVEYTSSDESIVKIDDIYYKEYTLGGFGTAKITATVVDKDTREPVKNDDGEVISVSFNLTVVAVPASLAWSKSTYTAILGTTPADYPTLTKKVNGVVDNTLGVTYSSSAEGVATVDAETGAVTLVGVGSTTITASVNSTDYEATPVSYTLTVAPAIKWEGNHDTSYTYNYGQAVTSLKAVANGDVTPAIVYKSDNEDVATVDANTGVVTLTGVGTANIKAIATINGNAAGELSYKITVNKSIVSISYKQADTTVVYTGANIALPALTVEPEGLTLEGLTYTTDVAGVTVETIGGVQYVVFGDSYNYATDKADIEVTVSLPASTKFAAAKATYDITLSPAIAWEDNAVAEPLYEGVVGGSISAPKAEVKDAALKLEYRTSDDRVATVDDGVVTLVAPGTATISAVAMNGNKEVQTLSYQVKVAKARTTGVLYIDAAKDFNAGTSRDPRLYAKVAGTEQEVATQFTGSFTNTNGVVTVSGSFSAQTIDAAEMAYQTVTVHGEGVTGGTVQASLFSDFSVISEEGSLTDGSYTFKQPLHNLYYKINGVTATKLSDIEFTPAEDQATITNATAAAVLAVEDGQGKKPDTLKNVEITGNNFDPTSSSVEGAYSEGQAVLVNFKPAEGQTVYYICKDGTNGYAAKVATGSELAIGATAYNSDGEIFPEYTPTFAIAWGDVTTTAKTDAFNKYDANQYIRIGEDRASGLSIMYYTVNAAGESSDLRTITFSNTTDVEDVMVDEEAGEAVYYNLQGVQIANPAKGQIYVRVIGKKADKVVF